jgi:HNH endonuclease
MRKKVRSISEHVQLARENATESGCWPWQGNINDAGYGRRSVGAGGRQIRAHRLVYELLVGLIPDGFQVDHLCHTDDKTCRTGPKCPHRRCVNPAHLEPVPALENWERGRSQSRENRDKQVCANGHPLTNENTYRHQGRGKVYRRCKTCIQAQNRASALRNIK